ncbi:MAG: CZB domain-containing protein [Oligoflexia bacterium]|nr:CZB domain-containing protein [Oligoflexia bacterium]
MNKKQILKYLKETSNNYPDQNVSRNNNMDDDNIRIEMAIEAHLLWFAQLKNAIEFGHSNYTPEIVRSDNLCELGKWLVNDFPTICLNCDEFEKIKSLHTKFHIDAAKVFDLALKGNQLEAIKAFELDSALMKDSVELILALKKLKRCLRSYSNASI